MESTRYSSRRLSAPKESYAAPVLLSPHSPSGAVRRQRSLNLEDDLPSIPDAAKTQCFTGLTILELKVRVHHCRLLARRRPSRLRRRCLVQVTGAVPVLAERAERRRLRIVDMVPYGRERL